MQGYSWYFNSEGQDRCGSNDWPGSNDKYNCHFDKHIQLDRKQIIVVSFFFLIPVFLLPSCPGKGKVMVWLVFLLRCIWETESFRLCRILSILSIQYFLEWVDPVNILPLETNEIYSNVTPLSLYNYYCPNELQNFKTPSIKCWELTN